MEHRKRGQALVEFAIVLPLVMALIGGIIQFGLVFWTQNTLTQVVRDTGRWAATQQTCGSTGSQAVVNEADSIASASSLFSYTPGEWITPPTDAPDAVAVTYSTGTCPPDDNQTVVTVTITATHQVPVFIPGMQYLPGMGKCMDGSPCQTLASTAVFRMEPKP